MLPFCFGCVAGLRLITRVLTGTLMRSIRDIENTGPERRNVPTANLAMTHNPYQPWVCGGNKVAAGEKK